jgi:hypothetical protein
MKNQFKLTVAVVGAALIVLATVFSVSAKSNLARQPIQLAAPAKAESAALAACTKMTGSNVIWVTLDSDGNIDQPVDSYPTDTTRITPVFKYNCVPKKTTLVTIFKLAGDEVFSDKESLKASNAKGTYAYPLGMKDDTALPDGNWAVEFYNNKTLLTSGEIVVGKDTGTGQTTSKKVTVQGTVTDKKSKKAIKGAVIVVLRPGITVKKFVDGGQKDTDVFTVGQTDSKGNFVLAEQLERNTGYSVVVVAKGYKATAADGFTISDTDPDPLVLTITMNK